MAKEYTPASRNREAFAAMTDTPGNVPPQAVELEEAVLGALMLEKDSIITVTLFGYQKSASVNDILFVDPDFGVN